MRRLVVTENITLDGVIDMSGGVSDHLNGVDEYVVERADGSGPGRGIVATGSIRLVHALSAAGLVDEYRLFVMPVVAGRGARLFETAELKLRLETRPFRSGAVLLRYGL